MKRSAAFKEDDTVVRRLDFSGSNQRHRRKRTARRARREAPHPGKDVSWGFDLTELVALLLIFFLVLRVYYSATARVGLEESLLVHSVMTILRIMRKTHPGLAVDMVTSLVKIRRNGSSAVLILEKEILQELGWQMGDYIKIEAKDKTAQATKIQI